MPQDRSARPPVPMLAAAAVTLPGAVLGALSYLGTDTGLPPYLLAVVFGTAIIGAAFLLSWAAEAIQVDVSAGLALAVLALVAVLPEYAVDFVFTFEAGQIYASEGQCVPPGGGDGSNPCALALANMTGANRVLVGIGWPLLVLVAAWSARRHRQAGEPAANLPAPGRVDLKPTMSTEVVFLGFATLYSLTLPLRTSLTLVDAAVLVAVFVVYAWRLAQAPAEDPDLIGTSEWVAGHAR
ncbi:hypothetical protein, partial [Modestobacter roseus]|uniref:hypothetical protein n=1 Tax=Modestobacter roseus TaxID=1181884 RepID=UPI0034DE24A6